MIYPNNQFYSTLKPVKNSGSLVAVEGHRQTPKKHTSKPLNWFLCVSYIQTALNLAISLLREYQYVCATLCARPRIFNVVQTTVVQIRCKDTTYF